MTSTRDILHHRPLREGDIDLVCESCEVCFPFDERTRWCPYCSSLHIAFNTGEGAV